MKRRLKFKALKDISLGSLKEAAKMVSIKR